MKNKKTTQQCRSLSHIKTTTLSFKKNWEPRYREIDASVSVPSRHIPRYGLTVSKDPCGMEDYYLDTSGRELQIGQKEGYSRRKVSAREKKPLTSSSFLLDTACSELLFGLPPAPTPASPAPDLTVFHWVSKYQSASVPQRSVILYPWLRFIPSRRDHSL